MDKISKVILGIIVVVLIIGGVWYGIKKEPGSSIGVEKPAPIKIGAVLPLSGDLAKYGEAMTNTVNLAVEQLKNSQPELQIQLILEDDSSCDPKAAVSAIQKLVNVNKVDAIVGPVCSSPFLAAASVAEQGKTIMISPGATSPSITEAGDYIFRTAASDSLKSIAVAKFAYEKGYKKAALLTDIANDSFVQQREDMRKAFEALGGKFVIEESLKTKDIDFRTQLVKIKDSEVDVVLFAAFYKEAALILKQAQELGIDVPFMTPEMSMEDPDLIEVAGRAAEGLIYSFATTPENQEYVSFIDRYTKRHNEGPPAFCAETYDAFVLAVKAIQESDGSKEDIKNKLYQVGQNYLGASGEISFDENGDVSKPFIIKTIKNGKFVPYED